MNTTAASHRTDALLAMSDAIEHVIGATADSPESASALWKTVVTMLVTKSQMPAAEFMELAGHIHAALDTVERERHG